MKPWICLGGLIVMKKKIFNDIYVCIYCGIAVNEKNYLQTLTKYKVCYECYNKHKEKLRPELHKKTVGK